MCGKITLSSNWPIFYDRTDRKPELGLLCHEINVVVCDVNSKNESRISDAYILWIESKLTRILNNTYKLVICFPIHQGVCDREMQLCITFTGGMYCICVNRYDGRDQKLCMLLPYANWVWNALPFSR